MAACENGVAAMISSRPVDVADLTVGRMQRCRCARRHLDPADRSFRIGDKRRRASNRTNGQTPVVEESAAASVGGPFGPNDQSRQPGRAADGGPRIGKRCTPSASLMDEVEEQATVGREIALLLVDAAFDPRPVHERVAPRMPLDNVIPARRSASKNDCDGLVSGRDNEQSAHNHSQIQQPYVTDGSTDHSTRASEQSP